MDKHINEDEHFHIIKQNDNQLSVNHFECIAKLTEENLTIREIVRKCLSFINLCQCFGEKFLIERKSINLLINEFNNQFNNSLSSDGFELLSVNKKFDNFESNNNNGFKSCQTHNLTNNSSIDGPSDQSVSDLEDNDFKPNLRRKKLKPKKSVVNTDISREKRTTNKRGKSVKSESKSDVKSRKNSKNTKKNKLSVVKSCKISTKKHKIHEKPVIDSNITYLCDWTNCGKVFKSKQNLKIHRDIHLEIKNYRCDWPGCDEAFLRKKQLDSHISGIHTNDKKFKCDWPGCCYQTCRSDKLQIHKRVHTGEKPYKCDWPGCEFNTGYEKGLQRHKMRHTGEKPYKCSWPQCEWSFRQQTHLNAHMLKHTGEKPFGCTHADCCRKFSSQQAMRFHYEKTHKLISNKP